MVLIKMLEVVVDKFGDFKRIGKQRFWERKKNVTICRDGGKVTCVYYEYFIAFIPNYVEGEVLGVYSGPSFNKIKFRVEE